MINYSKNALFAGLALATGMASVANAQSTNLSSQALSVGGGGDGTFSALVYADGAMDGGDFDPAGASASAGIVFRHNTAIVDVANSEVYGVDVDTDVVGTFLTEDSFTGASLTGFTSGLGFPNSPNLDAQLDVSLAEVAAGQSVSLTFEWTFTDSSGSARDVRVVDFLDLDMGFDGGFSDDLSAITADVDGYTELNPGTNVVVMGEDTNDDGTPLIDLSEGGVILDSSIPFDSVAGITEGPCGGFSGDAWNGSGTFSGIGLVDGMIDSSIANAITCAVDATNSDIAAEAGGDSGIAGEVTVNVPANGSASVSLVYTFGVNDTVGGGESVAPASVENWQWMK